MVTLSKIYTRTGDKGKTRIIGGRECMKHDLRVETYGTVDEANSAIGIARLYTKGDTDAMLSRIQHDLFDLGADLATPYTQSKKAPLRIKPVQVKRLEAEIDRMNSTLKPLDSFVLPGGSQASAQLHLARTIVRRAERLTSALMTKEKVNIEAFKYLNRLSDHLFVMARFLNDKGKKDVLWKPGVNREK